MKKCNYIAILLLAALCFGCSDRMEDVRPHHAVGFSASNGWSDESLVARSASGAAFIEGDRIGVFACYRTTDGTTDGTNTDFAPNYMLNQLVSFDGSAWAYSPVKYWPSDGSVDFWGYYPYDESHKEVDDGFVHECKTGFEPLYQAMSTVNAENGVLSGDGIGENGTLQLGFLPMLNRVNFTTQAKTENFDHEGDVYTDFHFLIKEFRVWGFFQNATYSMTDKKWTTDGERYTREKPLEFTAALLSEQIEGSDKVPGYVYDPDNGYCTESALVVSKGADAKELFGKPVYFIPLEGVAEDNKPAFEVVYVVLTKPVDSNEYKESGIVTRSGSLSDIFNGKGMIEKNININLLFGIDGVTVTCNLEDYIYKPVITPDTPKE